MAVVGAGPDAVEARRAVVATGKEAVVQRAVLATPLGGVGACTLGVARVVESLGEDAPLHSGVVGVVHSEVLLHGPREGAVVQNNVVAVLDVEHRHAVFGQVAGAEAQVAHDAVGGELHLVACQTDAAARCRLSGYGDVGLATQARRQVDGACHLEEHRARRVVARSDGPAERAFGTGVVKPRDVVDPCTAAVHHAPARGEAAVALGAGEGRLVGMVVLDGLKDGVDGHVGVYIADGQHTEVAGVAAGQFPAHKAVALVGRGRQRDVGVGVDDVGIAAHRAFGRHAHRAHALATGLHGAGQRDGGNGAELCRDRHVGGQFELVGVLRRHQLAVNVPALERVTGIGLGSDGRRLSAGQCLGGGGSDATGALGSHHERGLILHESLNAGQRGQCNGRGARQQYGQQ